LIYQHLNKIFSSVCLAFGVVILLGVVRGSSDTTRYFELKKSLNDLNSTVENLKSQNLSLETEIHNIKTSPQYAKKILKDRYHITDENEDVVFFAD
jgi:cell division protein FtsB